MHLSRPSADASASRSVNRTAEDREPKAVLANRKRQASFDEEGDDYDDEDDDVYGDEEGGGETGDIGGAGTGSASDEKVDNTELSKVRRESAKFSTFFSIYEYNLSCLLFESNQRL